jgi:isopenicillin N synthase-like dioxygenase
MVTSTKTEFSDLPVISVLSIRDHTRDRAAFYHAMRQLEFSLVNYGFAVLCDHHVVGPRVKSVYDKFMSFFGRPNEKKVRYTLDSDGQRGYTGFGVEHAKGNPIGDLKEFWHVGRPWGAHDYTPNVWPDIPLICSHTESMYYELDLLAQDMLWAIGLILGEKDPNHIAKMTELGNSILRVIHYPPLDGSVPYKVGAVRAAEHEDINMITLLVGSTAEGLQVKDTYGNWIDVPSANDMIVMNVGDMLHRITGGTMPSTTHRVVNPPNGDHSARFSMPFFVHPRPGVVLDVLDSCKDIEDPDPRHGYDKMPPGTTANEFLMKRLAEIGLT